MNIDHLLANRIAKLPPYLFVDITRKIGEKRARGEEVVSFAVGDPDIPTPQYIIESLCRAAQEPANHHYPESRGLHELREAIAIWYYNRFGVVLNPETEILPLIGSKEGIGHISFCFINPGDIALIPDPHYPVYPVGTVLAGGEPYYLPLRETNGFLPDLDSIPDIILNKAKILWLNYPNNPTGAICDIGLFKKAVTVAREHNIAVCHDGPYTEVAFDGYKPHSFLQAPGAKDVGIEFHSFSKTYNMTGWRIGWAAGNAVMIDALSRLKSNLDSGIPLAIQHMAISALNGNQEYIEEHNHIYQLRRDQILNALTTIGLKAIKPKASLYIWARVPEGYTSQRFTDALLEKTGVVVTPGTGYGNNGEGYIRISLTITDNELGKGLKQLSKWGKLT